jgi:hypothetical protein
LLGFGGKTGAMKPEGMAQNRPATRSLQITALVALVIPGRIASLLDALDLKLYPLAEVTSVHETICEKLARLLGAFLDAPLFGAGHEAVAVF